MRANGGNQLRGRNFITHFAVNAGFALVDFNQQYGFAVRCRFEAQRTHFLSAGIVVFRQERHGASGGASRHRHSSSRLATSLLLCRRAEHRHARISGAPCGVSTWQVKRTRRMARPAPSSGISLLPVKSARVKRETRRSLATPNFLCSGRWFRRSRRSRRAPGS
ncbi:hypothetical protein BG60_35315 [Caballeronia zhejiangensis]|uniref:Uncharacterized protein n=1 Tax=Caballeronia zhejiangensis TaxID=871203 RepID=A0A656QPC7_9BURK|nr:hypothetical protein BG60_35315 [Caballeronia zhejiangensis]